MGKNKNNKANDKAKHAAKAKAKAPAKKAPPQKAKVEVKKNSAPPAKMAMKSKPLPPKMNDKNNKKPLLAKAEINSKKIKEDKNAKNKNIKKVVEVIAPAKAKPGAKEQLALPLNKKMTPEKTPVVSKKAVVVEDLKGAKKKNEKEEVLKAKGAKGAKGDKEKSDADFADGFDDFEMDGDEIIDDTVFDPELLLEEEAKKVKKTKKVLDDEIREALAEEIINLSEEYGLIDVLKAIKSLEFFISDNIDCTEKACDNPSTTQGYCRYHYIKRWKEIKRKQLILQEGKLQTLIEDLISKHPFKYIEAILNDLMDEKTFSSILRELNIDMTSEEGFDDVLDDEMEEEDIAFETKVTVKVAFDED